MDEPAAISRLPIPGDVAVVLMNMGAADNPDAVEPFLAELFADPYIIRMPFGALYQKRLARVLARRRAPLVAPHYQEIGGSPLLVQTQKQALALRDLLGVPVYVVMRYSKPRAESVLREIAVLKRIKRIVAVALYPQYSRTTSESSLAELRLFAKARGIEVIAAPSYPDREKFAGALMARWNERMAGEEIPPGGAHVLLAAHGIPKSYVRRGDPYVKEVMRTEALLRRRLPEGLPVSIAFQSRLGPVKWVAPYLDREVLRLASEGCRKLVIFPVTFVSEHLETLWELDILIAGMAREAGIADVVRIPTVQDHPIFISLLADLVEESL